MAGGVGMRLIGGAAGVPPHAFWFGEDQARYVVSVRRASRRRRRRRCARRRRTLPWCSARPSGDALILPDEPPIMVSRLRLRHEGFMPALMSAGQKAA